MTNSEKLLMAEGLKDINIQQADGEDYARWFATFMPDSEERIALIWKASCVWEASDRAKLGDSLKAQGIDPEDMMQREMGGN